MANNEHHIETSRLRTGAIIGYRLLPCQRPTNPSKLWRGKFIGRINNAIVVELLEDGYVGLSELVKAEQIVSIDEFPINQIAGVKHE